jgi:arylsulfatase A-like enzyme
VRRADFRAQGAGVALLTVAILAVPSVGSRPTPALGSPAPPNVLIIMTDDQRVDTMGMMPRTLRWFDSGGTEFTNAFVTTPLCCPSRASIMTGRYVHNHDVHNNFSSSSLDQRSTLQRYLHDAGYFTGIAGKYLNDWDLEVDPPYFDRWAIQRHGYLGTKYNLDGNVKKVKKYTTDFIRDRAVGMLRSFEQDDARPWLLYVHPFAPHDPFLPANRHKRVKVPVWAPPPSAGEVDRTDKPMVVQSRGQTVDQARKDRKGQLRTLIAADQMVKRVMQELDRLGEAGPTLAFFLSDNGFFWAEHGLFDKRFPYTEAMQVPLFMRWPGRVAPGASDGRLAASIDVSATILDAAGIEPDPDYPLDGRTLLEPGSRERLLVEHFIDPQDVAILDWATIRTATYQYTEWYDRTAQEAVIAREYYDLAQDPFQLTNLLGDGNPSDPSPREVAQLSAQLERDRRCEGSDGGEACP